MRIIETPVPFIAVDEDGYEMDEYQLAAYEDAVEDWLKTNGYPGPLTGRLWQDDRNTDLSWYMYGHAEGAGESVVVWMPYSDFKDENIPFLPPHEMERRIKVDIEHERWLDEEELKAPTPSPDS